MRWCHTSVMRVYYKGVSIGCDTSVCHEDLFRGYSVSVH